ncbi:Leucine-rich repeat-containing protein 51 [Blyttiomyces sp. JEL0837]|nr:Leucine-rich repeat-containing protein 51 [Blyttiomyces sp. JEL0837]
MGKGGSFVEERSGKLSNKWAAYPKSPLDFSFKEIANIADMTTEEPRTIPELPKPPKVKVINQKGIVTAIRLPNNKINTMEGLFNTSSKVVENANDIAWIDLSFNNIKTIDKDILNFSKLSTLYLHANEITTLSEIDKLANLENLRTLTLHGNPIENCKGYRQYVVARIPKLKHLDFCAITKQDRAIARGFSERSAVKRRAAAQAADD